jgi:hypothetical protein
MKIDEKQVIDEVLKTVDIDYNLGTITYNKKINNSTKKGSKCGGLSGRGYIYISKCINAKQYSVKAHRLIFYSAYGYLPKHIDHINRIKTDNRLCNLRPSNNRENAINKGVRKNTKHGVVGVYYIQKDKTYVSHISINGKETCIGRSKYLNEAIMIRLLAEKVYYGEFSPNYKY